jgi:hypothetical protein
MTEGVVEGRVGEVREGREEVERVLRVAECVLFVKRRAESINSKTNLCSSLSRFPPPLHQRLLIFTLLRH